MMTKTRTVSLSLATALAAAYALAAPAVGADVSDTAEVTFEDYVEVSECTIEFCGACAGIAIANCPGSSSWNCYPTPYGCACSGSCTPNREARVGDVL